MFPKKAVLSVLVIALLLSACSPQGPSISGTRPPEPPGWVVTMPGQLQGDPNDPTGFIFAMGAVTVDPVPPMRNGGKCDTTYQNYARDYVTHLFENAGKRIAEFGGYTVVQMMWQAVHRGEFDIKGAAVRSGAAQIGLHTVIQGGRQVFMSMGNTPKPTAIPIITTKNETVAQAIGRLLGSYDKRLQTPVRDAIRTDLIKLAGCIDEELKARQPASATAPAPVAAPTVIPTPTATPIAYETIAALGEPVVKNDIFVAVGEWASNLTAEEIATLVAIGVVVVVGVTVIATGGASLPVLCLVGGTAATRLVASGVAP